MRLAKPTSMTRIIGNYVSPFVRKVLVALELKGVSYLVDPIVPYFGNDEFTLISPTRRIPVLQDDRVTVPDSSVICQYLEERYPEPTLFPGDAAQRARIRWLEEFSDSRLAEVLIWKLFNQRVLRRFIWGKEPDEAVITQVIEQDLPPILDYLEGQAPTEGFFFGALSLADVAVACPFRNAAFAGYQVSAERWPRLAGLLERIFAVPAFERLKAYEKVCIKTPPSDHRSALAQAGAPLTETTYGQAVARRA